MNAYRRSSLLLVPNAHWFGLPKGGIRPEGRVVSNRQVASRISYGRSAAARRPFVKHELSQVAIDLKEGGQALRCAALVASGKILLAAVNAGRCRRPVLYVLLYKYWVVLYVLY